MNLFKFLFFKFCLELFIFQSQKLQLKSNMIDWLIVIGFNVVLRLSFINKEDVPVQMCLMEQHNSWLFSYYRGHPIKGIQTSLPRPENTKGGSITVPLTSCLTGLESAVWQLTIFVFICKTDKSKPVKQEVNGTSPFSISCPVS
jgi:hypothetical protein